MQFLRHFVGEPRPGQSAVLEELEDSWESADVFVIDMPVGAGKSRVAEAVVRGAASGGSGSPGVILANNNVLLDQYITNGLRGFSSLRARQMYKCHEGGSCAARIDRMECSCRPPGGNWFSRDACPYTRDLRTARSNKKLVVNQHTYLAHKLYRPTVVVDEAHTLLHTLQDMATVRLWRAEYKWPRPLHTMDAVRDYFHSDRVVVDERVEMLRSVLNRERRGYSVVVAEEELRGQTQEVIKLISYDVRDYPPVFWPNQVQKLVLMSATLNSLDIEMLGLSGRRVRYLHSPSPIPVERRPFVHLPVADLTWRGRRAGGIEMAVATLVDDILPQHRGQRGLIHTTYGTARRIHELLAGHPRLVYHDRANKRRVLDSWLAGGYGDEAVLVGCGMHEGLDLAYGLGGFQVMLETPRPNLQDPGMSWLAEQFPQQYEWLTIREMAQAYGRICRGPDDFGVTISLDASAERELRSPLLPTWLAEAIVRQ